MGRLTVTVTVTVIFLMHDGSSSGSDFRSVATVPEYRTKLPELPSPDWYLPIRQILSILYSPSDTEHVWSLALNDSWTVSNILHVTSAPFVFAGIGVCLAAITVVAFLTFLCCRCCCSKCGANYRQSLKTSQDRPRINVLSVWLAFVLVVSLISLGYVYSSLPMKSHFVSGYLDSVDDNVQDVATYLNYIRQEIDELIEADIIRTINDQSNKLQNFAYDVGHQIAEYVRQHSEIDAVLTNLSDTAQGIYGARTLLVSLVNDTEVLNENVTIVNEGLHSLVADLATFVLKCTMECHMDIPSICNDCKLIDSHTEAINFNMDALNINLTEPLNDLDRSIARNVSGAVANFNSSFENLPDIVRNASEDTIIEIIQVLRTAETSVHNSSQEMDSFFDQLADTISNLHKVFRKDIDSDRVDDADTATWAFSLTIAIVLSVIWVLFASGLVGGRLAFDRKVSPTDRTGLSDFFGSLLLTASYLSLFVSGFLWLVQVFVSIPGVTMELYVCRPLFDQSYYLLDQFEISGRTDNDTSTLDKNFTITTMLHLCERNSSAMRAFRLDDTVGINETLQSKLKDVTDEWGSINVSAWNLELYPKDFEGNFDDFDKAVQFDFSVYLDNINSMMKNLSKTNEHLLELDDLLTNLTFVPALKTDARRLLIEVNRLNDSSRESLACLVRLQSHIEDWQNYANNLTSKLKYSLPALHYVGDALEQGVSLVVANYSVGFVNTIDNAISELIDSLFNDVGNCAQLWVIFQSLRMTTCRDVADSMNAFWFCLAVVLLFFLLAVAPAVKLSKYFRIMNMPSKKDDRFQRTQATRLPEKIHHTKNAYFDNPDLVPTVSNKIEANNVVLRRSQPGSRGPPPPTKPKPSKSKIQPIIMAFNELPWVPPRHTYEEVVQEQQYQRESQPAAIRLSSDKFDLYQRIPRVLTRSNSTMSTQSSATYMTLNQPSTPRSFGNGSPPIYAYQQVPPPIQPRSTKYF